VSIAAAVAQRRAVAPVEASPYRVADLRYRLIRGPVALEPLRILEQREITVWEWRIRLHILGASHAIQLMRGNQVVTELLACLPADARIPTRSAASATSLLLAPPLHGRISQPLPDDTICGSVTLDRFAIQTVGDELIGNFDADCRLSVDFPTLSTRQAVPPRTRIGWRIEGLTLEVETVHTYPEENVGLRSRTTFLLNEAAR